MVTFTDIKLQLLAQVFLVYVCVRVCVAGGNGKVSVYFCGGDAILCVFFVVAESLSVCLYGGDYGSSVCLIVGVCGGSGGRHCVHLCVGSVVLFLCL